jgi:hypothetical protein
MVQPLVTSRVRDLPVRGRPILVASLPIGVQGAVKITGTLRRCC